MLNEEALAPLLEKYGFVSLTLRDYSLQEQMNFFYNAEVIMAPHGAGLTHLAFAESGVRLLEFFAPAYIFPCYWQVANVRKLTYHYLLAEEREDPNPEDPDLLLDLDRVEQALLYLLQPDFDFETPLS